MTASLRRLVLPQPVRLRGLGVGDLGDALQLEEVVAGAERAALFFAAQEGALAKRYSPVRPTPVGMDWNSTSTSGRRCGRTSSNRRFVRTTRTPQLMS